MWTIPPIGYAKTNILDVAQVELTDTATIVTFDARYHPKHWILFEKDLVLKSDGNTYGLRTARYITPGDKLWMHESGQTSFTLLFDPLPLTTESFDFS